MRVPCIPNEVNGYKFMGRQSTPLREAMTTTISGNANIQGQGMHNTMIVMSNDSSCFKYSKIAIAKGNRKKKGNACFDVHE